MTAQTQAACMSATPEPSYVLRALGRDDVLAEASLRFSLGRGTTELDIEAAAAAVRAAVRRLRRVDDEGATARLKHAVAQPRGRQRGLWRRLLSYHYCGGKGSI